MLSIKCFKLYIASTIIKVVVKTSYHLYNRPHLYNKQLLFYFNLVLLVRIFYYFSKLKNTDKQGIKSVFRRLEESFFF